MPIKFVKGNAVDALINGDIDVLLHVCNNKGVMGSGIALEIKNKVPDAFTAYSTNYIPLGNMSVGHVGDNSNQGVVFNMVAQNGYGNGIRHLNYGALSDTLSKTDLILTGTNKTLGLPYKMGADRAGGDWDIVLEMVEYYLGDFDVVIYELEGK